MGNDGAQQLDLAYVCTIKVHSLICLNLKNFIDRVSEIQTAIEHARPRSSTGLQALCSLASAIEKSKLLIQHCSDCSKLFLAITADRILLRCESIRKAFDSCLGQIQSLVPTKLAAKISGIIEDLRGAKFHLEPSEDEAGKVMKALIRKDILSSDSVNKEELEALQFAAVRLKITSPFLVLMEKKSIRKLLNRIRDTDSKKKILEYLLYLLRKYAGQIGQLQAEDHLPHQHEAYKAQTDISARLPEPPPEFKCPISNRLMFDPVTISSGITYERVWIQKWFCEGNDTCPITLVRVENLCLTPNIPMKSLISKWSSDHGIVVSEPCAQAAPDLVFLQKLSSFKSVASIGSSLHDLRLQVSNVSLPSSNTNLDSDPFAEENNVGSSIGYPQMNAGSHVSPSKLDSLPWESQCKAVQHIKEQFDKEELASDLVSDNNYMKPLIKFLKNADDSGDENGRNDSADVLLSILRTSGIEMPPFDEDTIYALASFLDSEITEKALAIMEILSCQPYYKSGIVASGILPSILKVLDVQALEFQEHAMKILVNLSCNKDIVYHILYLGWIPKLVPLLGDQNLAGYCLDIMNIICDTEEGKRAIAETNSCIDSIATIVETGSEPQQETAMQILLSLCYEHKHIIVRETLVQSLACVSVNGNSRVKDIAKELRQILENGTEETTVSDCSTSTLSAGFRTDSPSDSGSNHPKRQRLSEFLGRRMTRFFLHDC